MPCPPYGEHQSFSLARWDLSLWNWKNQQLSAKGRNNPADRPYKPNNVCNAKPIAHRPNRPAYPQKRSAQRINYRGMLPQYLVSVKIDIPIYCANGWKPSRRQLTVSNIFLASYMVLLVMRLYSPYFTNSWCYDLSKLCRSLEVVSYSPFCCSKTKATLSFRCADASLVVRAVFCLDSFLKYPLSKDRGCFGKPSNFFNPFLRN